MIRKEYLQQETMDELRRVLELEQSVQMRLFLSRNYFTLLLNRVKRVPLQRVFEPLKHAYRFGMFQDEEFLREFHSFLCALTGKQLQLGRSLIFCFGHRDYNLLGDNAHEDDGFKVLMEITSDWEKEFDGYTSFIQNDTETRRILPIGNTASVIRTTSAMQSFVKYINHTAGKRQRFFIELFYRI